MNFKWCQIDPYTCTEQELNEELDRLSSLEGQYSDEEAAKKIWLNSLYGAFGSQYFVFYNLFVAEAVTLQGQDLIKYSEKIINHYFNNFWHKDHKTHTAMGITRVEQISGDFVTYCDTDSAFVNCHQAYVTSDFKGTGKEFIQKLYKVFLADYLNKCFDKYAERYKTKNIQNFELEKITKSALWLAKKKYMYDTVWKDPGIDVEPGNEITAKGVEIVQSSSPLFARTTLKKLIGHIFEKVNDFNVVEFTKILKKYKQEFKLQEIENVSLGSSINDYETYVLEDKNKLVLAKGIPMHVRAAAVHNNMLYNSSFKKKYSMIRAGDKIKYYTVKGNNDEVFAFIPGMIPVEFAPEIDYDAMFTKTILDPINRCIEAMGLPKVSPNLSVATQLF